MLLALALITRKLILHFKKLSWLFKSLRSECLSKDVGDISFHLDISNREVFFLDQLSNLFAFLGVSDSTVIDTDIGADGDFFTQRCCICRGFGLIT